MHNNKSKSYIELRYFLDSVPVIETHEHYAGNPAPIEDVMQFICDNYLRHDLMSSSYGRQENLVMTDTAFKFRSEYFHENHETFIKLFEQTNKTAYARGMIEGLKECWDMKNIEKSSLKRLEKSLGKRDRDFFEKTMSRYGIKAMITNIDMEKGFELFVQGMMDFSRLCRFSFPLPLFHEIHTIRDIMRVQKYLGRGIVCLDDYIEAFESFLKKCIDFGVVCLKDQTAYRRCIYYSNPPRSEAERIFNRIMSTPRGVFGDSEVRVLDDWLFHRFIKLAQKYDLPIQIHTGHMAGIRNDIAKSNAIHFAPLLEMYKDVRFDLFHGNWPFMDEYLFLGKNYPNVWLDLCWVQSIDPVYCVEFLKRAIVTVPHSKIMAFGADAFEPEWTAGYLVMARDNTAFALSEMVDSCWLSMNEAKKLAADWFFNNPNEFFNLGFEEYNQ